MVKSVDTRAGFFIVKKIYQIMQTKEKRGETSATAQKAKRAVKTAVMYHYDDGKTHAIEYRSINGLMLSIAHLLTNEYDSGICPEKDYDVRICLPCDGITFCWIGSVARSCIIENTVSFRGAYKRMIALTKKMKEDVSITPERAKKQGKLTKEWVDAYKVSLEQGGYTEVLPIMDELYKLFNSDNEGKEEGAS